MSKNLILFFIYAHFQGQKKRKALPLQVKGGAYSSIICTFVQFLHAAQQNFLQF